MQLVYPYRMPSACTQVINTLEGSVDLQSIDSRTSSDIRDDRNVDTIRSVLYFLSILPCTPHIKGLHQLMHLAVLTLLLSLFFADQFKIVRQVSPSGCFS